jgi:hypothetical protein
MNWIELLDQDGFYNKPNYLSHPSDLFVKRHVVDVLVTDLFTVYLIAIRGFSCIRICEYNTRRNLCGGVNLLYFIHFILLLVFK